MSIERVFHVREHLQPNEGEPIRSAIHATEEAAVVAWTVKPGSASARTPIPLVRTPELSWKGRANTKSTARDARN